MAKEKPPNIEALHRLAVRLDESKLTREARNTLLRAALISLRVGHVDISLAVDCSAILSRHKPRTVFELLNICTERTPTVLLHLCYILTSLKKQRRFFQTALALKRTGCISSED